MTLIAQATTALLALLDQECPREQFPYVQFLAYQAEDFTSPMEEGLSLYLFKVDIAADPRQGRTLFLSYLLTAWSPDPLRQQELLGWALHTVQGTAVLDQLLRLEILPLTISDLSAVWSMARTGAQPSVALMIRGRD